MFGQIGSQEQQNQQIPHSPSSWRLALPSPCLASSQINTFLAAPPMSQRLVLQHVGHINLGSVMGAADKIGNKAYWLVFALSLQYSAHILTLHYK